MRFWFGCGHKHTTFPITLRGTARRSDVASNTYIVCLECGREMPYDWDKMRLLKRPRKCAVENKPPCQSAIPV